MLHSPLRVHVEIFPFFALLLVLLTVQKICRENKKNGVKIIKNYDIYLFYKSLTANADGLKLTTTITTTKCHSCKLQVASLLLGAWQKFFFCWCEKHACTVAQLNVKRVGGGRGRGRGRSCMHYAVHAAVVRVLL